MKCNGLEYRLLDCARGDLEVHSCNHLKDAGVVCVEGTYASASIYQLYS